MKEVLIYRNFTIRIEDNMMCLTDMWKSAGSPESKKPAHWLRNDSAQGFIEKLSSELRVAKSQLLQIVVGKGKDQGTFAHWQIGVSEKLNQGKSRVWQTKAGRHSGAPF